MSGAVAVVEMHRGLSWILAVEIAVNYLSDFQTGSAKIFPANHANGNRIFSCSCIHRIPIPDIPTHSRRFAGTLRISNPFG